MTMNNKYIGHSSQLFGVEECRLTGGMGDGMRLLNVRNGKGLEFTVSADRCADISRLRFRGDNYGFFSANGYVGSEYYDEQGIGFLKSFTGGFLTTCGLTAVGSPCEDEGELLPLHGRVGNIPAESISTEISDEGILIKARVNHSRIFGEKLILERLIKCSLNENKISIQDTVTNIGDRVSPLMLLYHFNIGYPLLSEKSMLSIHSQKVTPRNEDAAAGLVSWDKVIPPTAGFAEQCYYHSFEKEGVAAIFNPEIGKGLKMAFDINELNYFTQWKMMGVKDYVLGLEPANCHPDGRDKMREEGMLRFIAPDEAVSFKVELQIIEDSSQWERIGAEKQR